MTGVPQPLLSVKQRLKSGKQVDLVTGRDLISWFNSERRTPWLINYISAVLAELGLAVEPDIGGSNLDVPINFLLVPEFGEALAKAQPAPQKSEGAPVAAITLAPLVQDATLRVRVLGAANMYPTIVSPNASLQVATTIMVSKDFSQLPVVQNRAVKGVISWKSIGRKLSLGVKPNSVSHFLETPLEIRADTPLIEAIADIAAQDYALINDDSGRLIGLV